jgi:hypothetical protein
MWRNPGPSSRPFINQLCYGKKITILTKQEGVFTHETEILHLPATTMYDTTFSRLQALYYVISHSYVCVCVCVCSNVEANESH